VKNKTQNNNKNHQELKEKEILTLWEIGGSNTTAGGGATLTTYKKQQYPMHPWKNESKPKKDGLKLRIEKKGKTTVLRHSGGRLTTWDTR